MRRTPVDCKRVQAAISRRMDGEHLSHRVGDAVDRHLPGCLECSAFEDSAWRLRESVRFGIAEAVPDLVEPIMAAVRAEASTMRATNVESASARPRLEGVPEPEKRLSRRRNLAPVVAAALVGAIVGSVVTGGFLSSNPAPLAVASVVRGVTAAAQQVRDYSASFAVTEYHFRRSVPVRHFTVHVAFSAPEKLRLDVVDNTIYPRSGFTQNNLSLVSNGSRWSSSGPGSCGSAESSCSVHDRPPFSSTTPLPTDLIVPVATLGQAEGLSALQRGTIAGR